MNCLIRVGGVACYHRLFLVERHLTHTVDGVVGVIDNLRHTVLSALHHHAAAEHAAEVCTLDGVHQTAGIDGNNTVFLPVCGVRIVFTRAFVIKQNGGVAIKHAQQIVNRQRGGLRVFAACRIVGGAVFIRTLLDTLILQLIIVGFTLGKIVILFNGDFRRQAVIVRAVVGDVQSAIAVHEGQVAVAVQTARTSCAQGNQVAVVSVVDRSRGVAEHRGGVGIHCGRTGGGVAAGEDGIEDGDARKIQAVPAVVQVLVAQGMEIFCSDIVTGRISVFVDGNG